jgi:putative hydrolase of the HAD superfamily
VKRAIPITMLFLDIDGVLLTNRWERHACKWAATTFKLEWAEREDRHRLTHAGDLDSGLLRYLARTEKNEPEAIQ